MIKIKQLWSSILGSQGIKQSAMTIAGDFTAAGFSAVALIVFSRVLGPHDFGEFSIGFSIVSIMSRLTDAGFAAATLKYAAGSEDHQHVNQVFSLALVYKIGICAVVSVIGVLFWRPIGALFGFSNQSIITLSFVLGCSLVFYEQLLTMLQSVHYFAKAVGINLIQSSFKFVGAIVLFFVPNPMSVSVLAIYLAAPLVPVLLSKWLLPPWFKLTTQISSETKQRVYGMVKHSSIAFISAGIIENVDVLFVQKYLTTYEAGLYSGVLRIALVLSLVAFSLSNVLNVRVSRYKTAEHRLSFIKKAVIIGLMALVGFICFIPFSQLLIYLTIGAEYVAASKELILLSASSFILIAAIPWIALFYSFKSNWYFSVSGVIQLAIVIVGNVFFLPRYGLEATAWTRLASRVFLLVFSVALALWFYHKENEKNS